MSMSVILVIVIAAGLILGTVCGFKETRKRNN